MMLSLVCLTSITACSEDKKEDDLWDGSGEEPDNNQDNAIPVKTIPVLDWGSSISEIRTKQGNDLELSESKDDLLRYVGQKQEITIDYMFNEGKLTGASLTQSKISRINDITSAWLRDYNKLASSDNAIVCLSRDKSTMAYGRIIKGSDHDYASVAWTYVDPDEEKPEGPDYSPSGQINGHSYVDLGTGIGWAVQNVGASSPEKAGGYYMWGETTSRNSCWWWYYSLYHGDSNSYLDPDAFYTPTSNISGTKYDAAKIKMGDSWRMPTRAELSSLLNNCQTEVGEYNGVKGFIVTGISGKSIFLPASGRKKKEDVGLTGGVYLWSSSALGDDGAYYLHLIISNPKNSAIDSEARYYGMPIRGVVDL